MLSKYKVGECILPENSYFFELELDGDLHFSLHMTRTLFTHEIRRSRQKG